MKSPATEGETTKAAPQLCEKSVAAGAGKPLQLEQTSLVGAPAWRRIQGINAKVTPPPGPRRLKPIVSSRRVSGRTTMTLAVEMSGDVATCRLKAVREA